MGNVVRVWSYEDWTLGTYRHVRYNPARLPFRMPGKRVWKAPLVAYTPI